MTYDPFPLPQFFQRPWNILQLTGLWHRLIISLIEDNSEPYGDDPQLMPTCVFFHHLYRLSEKPDKCVRILLLDFSKAFDRINHQILITKMEEMEIDPILLAWVRNFVTGRKQRVRIGKCFSSLEFFNNGGVPQRTAVLGSLFLFFIFSFYCPYIITYKYLH